MTTALVALAVAAGLACPAHMWWQARRGRHAACCPPHAADDDALGLHRRQQALRADLDTLAAAERSDAGTDYAVRP